MSGYGKFVPTRVTAANLAQYPFIEGEIVLIKDTGQVAYGTGEGVGQYQFIAGGAGESNTASNVGSGNELFAQKVGVDLQFRSFTSSDGSITFTENASELDVKSSLTQIAGKYSYHENYATDSSTSATSYVTHKTFTVPNDITGTNHLLLISSIQGSTQTDSEMYYRVRLNGVNLFPEMSVKSPGNFSDLPKTNFIVTALSSGDTIQIQHKVVSTWQVSTIKDSSIFIMSLD